VKVELEDQRFQNVQSFAKNSRHHVNTGL